MAEESWSNSPPSAKRMAEASWSNSPPSAEHHRGEAFGKEPLVVDDDVPVPGQKQDYTVPLKVDIHLKEKLDVVCTSNPDEADKRIREIMRRLGGMLSRSIGVDVEYTREDEPPQMAAVLQLCVEDLILVYHIIAATKWPKELRPLLQEKKLYTFGGFSIRGDKEKLKLSGLEINPDNLIHPSYKEMKQKINKKLDHKLWGISPVPNNLIEYASKDAYVTYKAWKKIETIKEGLKQWQEAEDHWDDPYYWGY
ncbi:unnamed protein product [Triticum turgidum subsp. durum]|uniref:3'-5' exonuclease domain-containing protein n=1 Tax=Triticum turgidum subsp. durum TaxID=4567 RepID=A0A9R1BIL6_TRITD|nr:unnamed protein product [Triticum turgidum subsp. durum]